jgi:site-specific DNA-cytosine methylase
VSVLVACEESQAVTKELRALGIEAFSCDIMKESGGHPEWHIQGDVVPLLEKDWDMIIAFPPCTHLAVSGARWFDKKREDGRQQQGIDFFLRFTQLSCPRVAIENPIGIMSRLYRPPDQIIQPYWFGDPVCKSTCLWLKGLPCLVPTQMVDKGEQVVYGKGRTMSKWFAESWNIPKKDRAKERSKTFPGIAKALALQWGPLVLK